MIMMIIRYTGHYEGETSGLGVTMPGDTREVSLDLGGRLIAQGNWVKHTPLVVEEKKMNKTTKQKEEEEEDDGDEKL